MTEVRGVGFLEAWRRLLMDSILRRGRACPVKSEHALFLGYDLSVRHTTEENPLHPLVLNDLTAGWCGVNRGRFGPFFGWRCRKPVGGSKVLSTFVRQFDRSGTLSAGRQAPCLQTSGLRSRASVRRAVAGLAVSLQRLILRHIMPPCQPLPPLWFTRSSRAPWSPLLASLSSDASSCPPPARHSVRS